MQSNISTRPREVSPEEFFDQIPPPPPTTTTDSSPPAAMTLEERVAALELEVRELRARLARVTSTPAGLTC
jgi:hypothetical protein